MEGIFLRPPPLWKFQLSFIPFFEYFGLTEPPTLQEILIPSMGGVWIFSGTTEYVIVHGIETCFKGYDYLSRFMKTVHENFPLLEHFIFLANESRHIKRERIVSFFPTLSSWVPFCTLFVLSFPSSLIVWSGVWAFRVWKSNCVAHLVQRNPVFIKAVGYWQVT